MVVGKTDVFFLNNRNLKCQDLEITLNFLRCYQQFYIINFVNTSYCKWFGNKNSFIYVNVNSRH